MPCRADGWRGDIHLGERLALLPAEMSCIAPASFTHPPLARKTGAGCRPRRDRFRREREDNRVVDHIEALSVPNVLTSPDIFFCRCRARYN